MVITLNLKKAVAWRFHIQALLAQRVAPKVDNHVAALYAKWVSQRDAVERLINAGLVNGWGRPGLVRMLEQEFPAGNKAPRRQRLISNVLQYAAGLGLVVFGPVLGIFTVQDLLARGFGSGPIANPYYQLLVKAGAEFWSGLFHMWIISAEIGAVVGLGQALGGENSPYADWGGEYFHNLIMGLEGHGGPDGKTPGALGLGQALFQTGEAQAADWSAVQHLVQAVEADAARYMDFYWEAKNPGAVKAFLRGLQTLLYNIEPPTDVEGFIEAWTKVRNAVDQPTEKPIDQSLQQLLTKQFVETGKMLEDAWWDIDLKKVLVTPEVKAPKAEPFDEYNLRQQLKVVELHWDFANGYVFNNLQSAMNQQIIDLTSKGKAPSAKPAEAKVAPAPAQPAKAEAKAEAQTTAQASKATPSAKAQPADEKIDTMGPAAVTSGVELAKVTPPTAELNIDKEASLIVQPVDTSKNSDIWNIFARDYNNKAVFRRLEAEYGLTWQIWAGFMNAIVGIESSWNPNAKSWAEARGLMQVIRGTWNRVVRSINNGRIPAGWDYDSAAYDKEKSAVVGSAYFAMILENMLDKYAGRSGIDLEFLLKVTAAGYNAGEGRSADWYIEIQKKGSRLALSDTFSETHNYLHKMWRRLTGKPYSFPEIGSSSRYRSYASFDEGQTVSDAEAYTNIRA